MAELTVDEMHRTLTAMMSANAQISEQSGRLMRLVRDLHGITVVPAAAPSGEDPSPLADGLDNMLIQRLRDALERSPDNAFSQLLRDAEQEVIALRREVRRLRHIEKQRVEASWAASPDRMGR